MSEKEDEPADEDVCPFCSNSDLSCGHFAGEFDCFEGGFTGGRACPELSELWDALSLAVQRAARGGKIKLAKSPNEWGGLLQAAQKYVAAGGDPDNAVSEHLGEMLQVACDLADGPSVHSVYTSSRYGGFPSEFPVQLFWTSSPGEYAEHVKRMTKAVLASVEPSDERRSKCQSAVKLTQLSPEQLEASMEALFALYLKKKNRLS